MAPSPTTTDPLSETFSALSHPARRAILDRLATGEASVGELAAPLAMSLPAVSRHIRVLERAGLISQGRRAQYRPCTLEAQPLQQVAEWTEQYRSIWEASFDRLDAYVHELVDDQSNQPTKNPSESKD